MSSKPDSEKEILLTSAEQMMEAGRYAEAAVLYGRLVEQYPGEESFLLAQAWAFHDSGSREEAICCFETLFAAELKLKVFTGFAFDELVRLYRDGRQYDRLVAICRQAVEAQPDEYPLLRELGNAFLVAGMTSEAVEVFEKITRLEPDAPELFCLYGDALVADGKYDAAEAAYGEAVALDPEAAAHFYQRLANALAESGALDRAEILLSRSLATCPGDPLCLIRLAEVQVKQQHLFEARHSVEAAVACNPIFGASYYNRLARALADAGCHFDAVEMFDRAIALEENNAFFYLYQAESYEKLNLPEQAEEARRKAKGLSAGNRA